MRYGIGETLFKFDDSMTPNPSLAEKAETEDYITWVITLKDGIKFSDGCDMTATKVADTVNDNYLKTSGDKSGIASYGQVCDLLVNWHIQEIVLPSITVQQELFDPYDETQVDLSGIANAR